MDSQETPVMWRWPIRTVRSEARKHLDLLIEHLTSYKWDEDDIKRVRVAVEEALVNAITHGNDNNPIKRIEIHCTLSVNTIEVTISDQGRGFTPAAVPDPTLDENLGVAIGLGWLLMRTFMDTTVRHTSKGCAVTLRKQRSAQAV